MAILFENTSINRMSLKNRIVRSATWEGMCDPNGRPLEKLVRCYQTLAQGGVGLIITGYTFVCPEGKQLPGKMGIHTDDFANDFIKLTGAVHDAGGKIAIQLVHAGGQANPKVSGCMTVAPSAIKTDQFPDVPEELTTDQITDIVRAFGAGARRAKDWGFDAVQLHAAHGYLINQFLSPLTNRRSDEYGGNIGNRSRFIADVYREVREQVGADYPVLVKLNATDYLNGGLETDDAAYAARMLSQAGVDAIEVSSGTGASGDKTPVRTKINSPDKEAYNLELALRIKTEVKCPVMAVGGFRSYETAQKAVSEKHIDYIAMSRPLIREPDLPNRWLNGDRSAARCISCNTCFRPGVQEGGIYCVAEKKEQGKGRNKNKQPGDQSPG